MSTACSACQSDQLPEQTDMSVESLRVSEFSLPCLSILHKCSHLRMVGLGSDWLAGTCKPTTYELLHSLRVCLHFDVLLKSL